eukprot:7311063-Pyramimonas_sp.AAC.1
MTAILVPVSICMAFVVLLVCYLPPTAAVNDLTTDIGTLYYNEQWKGILMSRHVSPIKLGVARHLHAGAKAVGCGKRRIRHNPPDMGVGTFNSTHSI